MWRICGIALMLMMIVLTATAAPAPESRLLGGFETSIWLLLKQNDSRLRDELKLTENQVKKIEDLIAEERQASSSLRGPDGKIDRQKSRDRQELYRRHAQTAAKILTKHQLLRAEQIYLQRMGPTFAFRTSQVATALKLTDEQKEKIDLIRRKNSGEFGLPPAAEGSRQERSQRLAEVRKRREEELLNVLTPAQKAKWNKLIGEPFKLEYRGSGGGK